LPKAPIPDPAEFDFSAQNGEFQLTVFEQRLFLTVNAKIRQNIA
jgi:hypothetical protein